VVNYGTVVGVRDIDIIGDTSSAGGLLGGVAGLYSPGPNSK